jgi:uncharacterized SAM-binding protein YcdF (DUF218 family)
MPRSDVIVVFGAAVREGGRPSGALQRRLLHGVELLRQDLAPFLLVTGGGGRHGPSEAEVMRDLALGAGVPGERIVMETASTSTFTSALACLDIMRARGWQSALVVSDAYHLRRAAMVLRSFGIRVSTSAAPGAREANRRARWWYYVARETIAQPIDRLRVARERTRRRRSARASPRLR